MSSVGKQFISTDYGQSITESGASGSVESSVVINSIYLTNQNKTMNLDFDILPGIDEYPTIPSQFSFVPVKDGITQSFFSAVTVVDGKNVVVGQSTGSAVFMPDVITIVPDNYVSSSGNIPEAKIYNPSQDLAIQTDVGVVNPAVSFAITLYFSQEMVYVPDDSTASWEFYSDTEGWLVAEGAIIDSLDISIGGGALDFTGTLNSTFHPEKIRYTANIKAKYLDSKGQHLTSFEYDLQNVA